MKTVMIRLESIKSESWAEVIQGLGLEEVEDLYFKYGEYADLELTVDEKLNVTGKIVQRNR